MAYFKPKNAVYGGQGGGRLEQPFYLSWFQQQGELKRGGTAPHESRKVMEQQRNQQQAVQAPTMFRPPPEPVQRPPQQKFKNSPYIIQQQPRRMKQNLQEISKIYTANGQTKLQQQKRKSQEMSGVRGRPDKEGENKNPQQYQQFSRTFNPTSLSLFQRTYTSSQQRNQKQEMQADVRPISQQQSGNPRNQVRQNQYIEDQYQERNIYEQCEDLDSDLSQNHFQEDRIQNFEQGTQNSKMKENISDVIDSDNDEDEDMEVEPQSKHGDGFDHVSNESQGAESKRNSLSPREKGEEQMANRSAFQQGQNGKMIVESLRKNTINMHRPMSSEGGRRRRNQHAMMNENQYLQTEKPAEEINRVTQNSGMKRTTVDIFDVHDVIQVVTVNSPVAVQVKPYNHFPDNPTTRVGECYQIDDFDEVEVQDKLPSNRDAIRSGYRGKPSEPDVSLNDIPQQNGLSLRPPSRHKIPPKAVGLEVPNIADLIDIPIKNMYVNVDFDNSFDDMIKVNNKLQSNFMKKVNEDECEKRPIFNSQDEKSIYRGGNQSRGHPQSANQKYNGGSTSQFFPVGQQVQPLHSTKAAHPNHNNNDNFEIVIKHNTSSHIQKVTNQLPVKVPFQTSLGQDFLRLFANQNCNN